jgi:hypothetical protein
MLTGTWRPTVTDRVQDDERVLVERLAAAQCLRNAHNHIATAYSQIDGTLHSPAHRDRMIHETLHAVDWIRRALEHVLGTRVDGESR